MDGPRRSLILLFVVDPLPILKSVAVADTGLFQIRSKAELVAQYLCNFGCGPFKSDRMLYVGFVPSDKLYVVN